jgi:WD40 repeat protein
VEKVGLVRHEDIKYHAFISYSSRDRRWAAWLGRALERYPIPKALVGRTTAAGTVPSRLYPVFVDREELRAGGEVGDALQAALKASRVLIVICSPAAADPSSWVSREIEIFKAAGREADVLALIVDGAPHASRVPGREGEECFPQPLRFRFDEQGRITDEPADPLAADVRREDARPRAARRKALLKLIARMIDVRFDDLAQRDRRRRKRQAMAWTTAVAVLLAVLAVAAGISLRQGREALSQRLAEAAGAAVAQPDLALLLAATAWRTAPTPAAHRSLVEGIQANPHLVTYLHRAEQVQDVAFSPDGSVLAIGSCSGTCPQAMVSYHRTDTDAQHGRSTPFPGAITHLRFQSTGRLLVAYQDGDMQRVAALDPVHPETPPSPVFSTTQPIAALAVSDDGNLYAVATDTETKIFDARAGGLRCWVDTGAGVVAMAFAPGGRYFAAAADRGGLGVLWTRLEDGHASECRATPELFSSRPGDVGFDARGALYVAGRDGVVLRRGLDPPMHTARDTFSLSESSAEGYEHWFGAGSKYLLSHFGRHVRMYDLDARQQTAEALREALEQDAGVNQIDALRRALGSVEVARLHHVDTVRAVMDREGRMIATADRQGNVRLWTIATGTIVTTSSEHAEVEAEAREAVSPDGRLRVVADHRSEGCSGDFVDRCQAWTELRLFDARSGAEIATVAGPKRFDPVPGVLAVEFAPDGRLIVRREMLTEVWTLAPDALVDRACRMASRALTVEELAPHAPAWWQRALLPSAVCERGAGPPGRL